MWKAKSVLTLVFLFVAMPVTARQWDGATGGTTGAIYRSGSVGIGTTSSPESRLHVEGGNVNLLLRNSTAGLYKGAQITFKNSGVAGTYWQLRSAQNDTTGSSDTFRFRRMFVTGGPSNDYLDVMIFNNQNDVKFNATKSQGQSWGDVYVSNGDFRVEKGDLLVGNGVVPGNHKMAVEGSMIAEEVVVQLESSWPDYVFADNYDLPTLDEVQQYITAHKHLPGVPTAADVAASGVELGSMQATLLEKIEELTLYLIEMKAENEALASRVAKLEAQQGR